MSPKKDTQASAKSATASFTDEERAAIQERSKEVKAAARRGSRAEAEKEDGESAVLTKIAEMQESDRVLGERIHAIVKANAPALSPKLWYGMPAYARDGKVVCFFQSAAKFKTRYATLGFSDEANLDEGAVWPVYYAVKSLTPADEAKIAALLKQAVG
jgi:uncharacterized protein YdhG (YjbR/CyaY superfamily)